MKKVVYLVVRAVGAFLILASFGLLAFMGWDFEASRSGTSAEYWEYLCGVQLSGFKGHQEYSYHGGTYPVVDGKAYYYAQMHHESPLYKVPVEDVLHDAPNVQEQLTNPQPPSPSTCVGYQNLCELYREGAARRSECAAYFRTVKVDAMDKKDLEALRTQITKAAKSPTDDEDEDAEFRGRLDRAKRVWATVIFEAIYISAWLMYVIGVPPIRVRWHWRVAGAPFLLFLPYFLGYAAMTFTFGPSGGFVYPIYLMLASLPMQIVPCSPLDGLAWKLIPQILSGLSQVPGRPAAYSFAVCVGPISSIVFGVVLLTGVLTVIRIGRWFKARRERAAS